MDKFLVDLDSVLDKLEAEDADRCATETDDDDHINLIGSSVYRNSDIDKTKHSTGGSGVASSTNCGVVGGSISVSGGISHHLSRYEHHYQESKIGKSDCAQKIAGNSSKIIPDDGGSNSNNISHDISQLDSFLSSSQSTCVDESSVSIVTSEAFGKNNILSSSQMEIETTIETSSKKSNATRGNNNNRLLFDGFKDEPNISTFNSSSTDIGVSNLGDTKADDLIAIGDDGSGGGKQSNHEHNLTKPLASYLNDDTNINIQQSVNLEKTYNNTINHIRPVPIIKDINEAPINRETITELSDLVESDSFSKSTPSTSIITPSKNSSIGEEVTISSDNNFGDLLSDLSTPTTSSTVLSHSEPLLDSLKGTQMDDKQSDEEKETVSDEEMTEEEMNALEKELETELERMNNQTQVSTLEDIIESESIIILPTETETIVSSSVTLSPPLSSKSPPPLPQSSSVTIESSSSSSSSLSPSSPSPSTSSPSLSIPLSKPIETSTTTNDASLLINQTSESHQSSSTFECKTNGNEATIMVNNEENSSTTTTISDNDATTIMVSSSKPNRPVTLSLTNNQQPNQPGHTPMHGDDGELIPIPSPVPLESTQRETELEVSSSDQIATSNNNDQSEPGDISDSFHVSMSSLGYFKPFWIPDEDAPQCMICDTKFTVMKRRHHCRACGKVLCAQCSRFKAPLAYLSYEKARVCDQCLPSLLLSEGGNISAHDNSFNDSGRHQIGQQQQQQPNVLGAEGLPVPSAPPSHQLTGVSSSLVTGATAPSSSSAIQPVSVLRRPSKPRAGEPKQVIFSDGIRPGNDLKDDQVTSISHRRHAKKVKSPPIEKTPSSPGFSSSSKSRLSKRIVIHDANGQLPPILNAPALHCDPTFDNLLTLLEKEDEPPVTFSLTKNLMALVKLVKLDCCTNELCWTFTSQNLSIVGQDEIIVVVEKMADENVLPRDIFRLFAYIYDSASKGYPFSELSHVLYPDGFFGLKDFPSFIFIRPTFQCLNKLTLPTAPFLIGVLIHRFEVPWAKLFPLRLILRLGSKYHCYPCPIVSYRSRRPSYFEIGHTVMDILADFRNFQYTLPVIPGLTIHTEAKRTTVTFPKNRYDKVMKALGSANEFVLSFGGTFSLTADSHLTCIQNDDGQYHTQTIRLHEDETSEPKITGANFIVFSGALKSSTGMMAKMSVVEDGLLVQVSANTLNSLKSSLKDMKDFIIEGGKKDAPSTEESVSILWGEDDKQFNLGVRSCIDGLSLEGINSIRMFSGTDFEGDKYLIRWVELFLIENTELPRSSDGYDAGRAAEIIAQSFCPALVPCLESLIESKIAKIGLRVTLDPEKIGYDVGSNGSPLPSDYINRLDGALIPIIMGNIAPNMEVRLIIELIFYILVK